MITVVYSYTYFGFQFHLLPFNITTARVCVTAFHYLFGDNIWDFYCVFCYLVFGILWLLCKDFLHIYAPFLGHNISNYLLIIASHQLRFTHIIWDFLGRIPGQTLFAHVFLTMFPYTSTLILGCRAPV